MSCNEMWGDHSLGNNLSLLEGDKKEDRIIVYCSNAGGVCRSGIPVVPKYNRQFDSIGRYAEYVELAVSNEKWVAVRTLEIKNGVKNYWLISKDFTLEKVDCQKINCDSILQSHVIGPLQFKEFYKIKDELNVKLNLE